MLNRELLLRAFSLGFTKLSFADSDDFAPIVAKNTSGMYVFMPLRGVDAEKIREAVNMSEDNTAAQRRDSDKTLQFRGKKPESRGYTPVTPIPEKTETVNKSQVERSADRVKKEVVMPNETKEKPGFQVVGSNETDHFEELLTSIMNVRVKAKEVFEMTGVLTRYVKEAQRAQKAKEREFKSTRDLLGKLKKVSGF